MLLFGTACEDGTRIEGPNVGADWSGTASFGTNGFSAGMSLAQTGSAVSGTGRIAGGFIDGAVTGSVDADGRRFTWAVLDGCEVWGGTLDVNGSSDSMEGPFLRDTSGCADGRSSSSGTLRLTRD